MPLPGAVRVFPAALVAVTLAHPSTAAAQGQPPPVAPAIATRDAGRNGIEIGASSSLALIFPGNVCDFGTFLRPHAGVSWHCQASPAMDVRLDLQGFMTGALAPYVAPRVALCVAWHRPRRVW